MIGQGHYIGIVRFMADFLTEKALNGIVCQYDGWEDASPLWLVTNLNQNDPRLVKPRKELVSMLVANGANATIGDEKPLIEATERWHDEVVRLVLETGIDPDMQDKFRHTAMEWARYNEDEFIINLLKEFGATEI